MKSTNMVGWFEIYVKDLERAKKFYETVFDIKIEKMQVPATVPVEMYAFPGDNGENKYGAPGALVKMSGYEPSGMGTIVYFSSEDCSIEESRVISAGGKVITPKTGLDQYGFMTLITDTEGNTIGIHSMV